MNFYKLVVGLFIFFVLPENLYAQYSITGPTTVNLGETKTYSFGDDTYGYPPYGDLYYYDWYSDEGLFTATDDTYYGDYEIPIVSVEWTVPATSTYIYVDVYDDYFNDYWYTDIEVEVIGSLPDDPGDPTAPNNVCNPVLTRSATPQNGDVWYWQGKDPYGTSITKGSGATYIPNQGSGTYYIRAKSTGGHWSENSGSVDVTIISPTLWYTDIDNDGYGDPASTPISNCTKPSGRVSNNFDQCPTVAGNLFNNGCPGDGDLGSSDKNYVHTITPLIPVSDISQITNNNDKIESVSYFDGLGRVIQNVSIRSGGQNQDIKSPLVYDEFGRQAITYLPHATVTSSTLAYTNNSTLIGDLNTYYVSKHATQLNSSSPNAYTEKSFDASPLSRVLETGTPGEDWKVNIASDTDHTTKYEYNTNSTNEVYKIDYSGAGQSLSIASYYVEGTLLKNSVKNENWTTADGKINTKEVFTDKSGKKIAEFSYILESTVLKTLKTYYVYDDTGNMVYVLTPKIFSIISGTTISVTNLNDLAFQYVYDTYNRQIEQRAPGKEPEYMVYDQLDRPILTQDKNLKDDGKWLFTKYDAFGRAVYSGLFSSASTRATLQTAADSYISANTTNLSNIEARTTTTTTVGGISINYSNNAYPTTGLEVLTVNYFDDYTFTDSDKPIIPTTILGQNVTTRTKGFSTASWTKTLGAASWGKIYSFYDEQGGLIKVYEKNYLGGYTDNQSKLDFRGKIESSTTTHKRLSSSTQLTIQDRFEYDHQERPLEHFQTVNSNPEQRIAKNTFNELGVLVKKEIGGTSGVALQSIDYTFDIRGSLKGINDVDNIGTDLFAFELNYESGEGTNYTAAMQQYNGNISQMVWKSAHNNTKKSYLYTYDDLNRFSKAQYGEGTSLTTNWNKFEVIVNGYDYNGNISGLKRRKTSTSFIDDLTYYYDTGNGNQLMKIEDASTSEGFINGNTNSNDYAYDDNGNLTKDLNKNISLIEYNHLDLVTKVNFINGAHIDFLYDASGAKLQMKYVNGGNSTTTDYIGGFQYVNNTLQFFPTPEGYVDYDGGNYTYVYSLKDHLGNNRVSFKDGDKNNSVNSSDILSNTDYYPMGLAHSGEFILNSNYNFKFQGKEQLLANGYNMYDFGSRMYDGSVGRWFNVDPQNQFGSPYVAMGNIWVIGGDPNGEWFGIDDVVAGAIGAAGNVIGQAMAGNINSWKDGFAYACIGFVAGLTATYTGGMGTAAILSAGNSAYGQYDNTGRVDILKVGEAAFIGAASAGIAAPIAGAISSQMSTVFSGVKNTLVQQMIIQSTTQAGTGFTLSTSFSLLQGESLENSLKAGTNAAASGFVSGAVTAFGNHVAANNKSAREAKLAALAEDASEIKLNSYDARNGGHLQSKHGASTTNFDQMQRANSGINPGESIVKNKADASRFYSSSDALELSLKAQVKYRAILLDKPHLSGSLEIKVISPKIIGGGYLKNSFNFTQTNTAIFKFDVSGNYYTGYPLLRINK
ncbi:hypothetical protein EC396_14395 [Lutibacter sp. HS1-25]|nr:hypothetical protein EC396_14395 [Lutibacter sp. HS1-25]